MAKQPSKGPYERYGLPPRGSVPHSGAGISVGSKEEALTLANPVGQDRASIQRGQKLFTTYCAVCHGEDAGGMGPVSMKFIPAPDIKSDYHKVFPDGYFIYVITLGGAVMPAYAESMGDPDMWDVVNYIREMQHGE